MPTIDPPYRLDPLQTIINVVFKTKKRNKKPTEPDQPNGGPDTPPGDCKDCNIIGCPIPNCFTCFCPGILCIGPGGCCAPANCVSIGIEVTSLGGLDTTCASQTWVVQVFYNCCTWDDPLHHHPCTDAALTQFLQIKASDPNFIPVTQA